MSVVVVLVIVVVDNDDNGVDDKNEDNVDSVSFISSNNVSLVSKAFNIEENEEDVSASLKLLQNKGYKPLVLRKR